MGKSTSAQILAKEDGYVYYEADCFALLRNPYVSLDAKDASMAQLKQKVLKGPGDKERQELANEVVKITGQVMSGQPYDKELFKKYYQAMAEDIKREKARIGGSFAVAHVVLTRELRDCLRDILGPDLVIINLTMSDEDRKKRILARHMGDENAWDAMEVGPIMQQTVR